MAQLFPFTAIVGQEELKLALILNIIDPTINGVLIMGDRGTGKSTTVRSLLDLLPEIRVVKNDPFNRDPLDSTFTEARLDLNENKESNLNTSDNLNNVNNSVSGLSSKSDSSSNNPSVLQPLSSHTKDRIPQETVNMETQYREIDGQKSKSTVDPFIENPRSPLSSSPQLTNLRYENQKIPLVDLPLGATEDRVCGTLDIEKALTQGVKAFEPGLLAKANRGILYVDEVNLLDDHLVDILLDAAASGWNTVEREGISLTHPAKFILIGSGNPEEGELRPQLLDRFGMHAEIHTVKDAELRVQIVEQRSEFDANPKTFLKNYENAQKQLKEKILEARQQLPNVTISYSDRIKISQICSLLNVDGLRGDIICNRAAKAYAAMNSRTQVTVDDILTVVSLCLRHRLRKDPLETIELDAGSKVKEIAFQVFDISAPVSSQEKTALT